MRSLWRIEHSVLILHVTPAGILEYPPYCNLGGGGEELKNVESSLDLDGCDK